MFSFYANEWRRLLQGFDTATCHLLCQIAHAQNQILAEHFYSAMLEDEAASNLLSHEQVHARLMASMQRWIVQVLGASATDDLEALVTEQVKIGEVHARIDVPVHLVLRGARRLKEGLGLLLYKHAPSLRASTLELASNLIDQAMEAMSQGYAVSRDGNSRTKEAYRLFTATQNLATVREQRRAELLAWENQCLYLYAMGGGGQPLSNLSSSDFGLWFRHKGLDMFHGAPAAQS
ncbi:MAG: protoglobin domain-containing protein, partial [Comamonas sp.]